MLQLLAINEQISIDIPPERSSVSEAIKAIKAIRQVIDNKTDIAYRHCPTKGEIPCYSACRLKSATACRPKGRSINAWRVLDLALSRRDVNTNQN